MSYCFKILYSGSDGNAALLSANGCAVLIDAGRSARTLTAALREAGVDPAALSAIFLTHEHRDHTAALDVFLRHHSLPVHTAGLSRERLSRELSPEALALIVPHPPIFTETVGPFTFASFPTPHDSDESVGYRVTIADGGETHTVGYATDLGSVNAAVERGLMGCETVVLECNHDEQMLADGPYPAELKRRIASRRGHLSNADCAAFSARLAEAGMKHLALAHLSKINNLPELALGEVSAALAGTGVTICVAAPDRVTEL